MSCKDCKTTEDIIWIIIFALVIMMGAVGIIYAIYSLGYTSGHFDASIECLETLRRIACSG